MARRLRRSQTAALALLLPVAFAGMGAARGRAAEVPGPDTCGKIVLNGEVSAGHEWKAAFGGGWVFRVLPIPDNKTAAGVGGWDLVVDREDPAGFPDALLVATPPYNLINPREIGNTYGLRAQDAIGWNPRHFRFMTNRGAFRQEQKLYLLLNRYGELGGKGKDAASARKQKALERAKTRFMKLARESSPGEFDILDARLTHGIGTVKPYATNWALESAKMPHTEEPPPDGTPTALGNLDWMRFSVTLWVPGSWRAPRGVRQPRAPCPE
ncbi:MAG: hypothetical protein ACRD25_02125 [Terracidiphilus sp.]